MHPLLSIILLSSSITVCVFVGALFLLASKEKIDRILILLVSLSAGTLIGGAALHLLPEAAEKLESDVLFEVFLLSFTLFFFIEKVLHWRHCHNPSCSIHPFGYMNLIGDSVHNFIDGLLIAATFVANPGLGVATTVAVAVHEIPQEIGDFGVLLYAGFKKKVALVLNYAVALTVVLGGVVGYVTFHYIGWIIPYLLPFAAGGFIYIAASDLIPEMKKESSIKKSAYTFVVFIFGIGLMYAVKFISH
jgi:zinc and cadmium transporter